MGIITTANSDFSRNEFELGLPYTGVLVFWATDSASGSNLCLGCNFSDRTGLALRIVDGSIQNQFLLQNSNIREVSLPVSISAGTYNISWYPGATYVDRVTCGCGTNVYSLYSVEVNSESSELQTIIDGATKLYVDILDKAELQSQIDTLTSEKAEIAGQLVVAQAQLEAISTSSEVEEETETIADILANLQSC